MTEQKRQDFDTAGLLAEIEVRRRRQWRQQSATAKAYQQGSIVDDIQDELPLNLNVCGNADLPLAAQDFASPIPLPKLCQTSAEDSKYIHPGVRSRPHSHLSKTLAGKYHAAAKKIAEQRWLDANGRPEATLIKDPSRRLRRLLEQKLHPETSKERPQLPQTYQEQAGTHYPLLKEPLSHLLYLRDICAWSFNEIAFRLNSSTQQVERWYHCARLLNALYERMRKLSSNA